jgi:ribosomal protein S18 acetylase RimI-like enzyme
MDVVPDERRRKVGSLLLDTALARLRAVPEIEQVELAVVTSEAGARRLYRAVGFVSVGTVPAAMKVGERRYDEELLMHAPAPPEVDYPSGDA